MRVSYLHGYYPERHLDVVEIRHILSNTQNHYVLVTEDGEELDATAFTMERDGILTAWLPENW